jgi:hypothetical protein
LEKTIFPLGDLTKPEVRELAKKNNLITARKKESMGICFVGKVGIKEFLQQYIESKPGKIIDQNGKEIGMHDGAIFYTIGQRHGLEVGGGIEEPALMDLCWSLFLPLFYSALFCEYFCLEQLLLLPIAFQSVCLFLLRLWLHL